MTPTPRAPRLLLTLAVIANTIGLTGFATSTALAQNGAFLEFSGDISPVEISGADLTWQVAHLAGGMQRAGRFGWMARTDRHQRDQLVDVSWAASGFRRLGDWTVYGEGAFSPNPTFLYRRSLEGELSRTLVGTLVGHAGYRHLEFPTSTVSIIQPGVSLYFRRGELQARGFLVHNRTMRRRTSTALMRGALDVTSQIRLTGGFARGARIFDVSAIPNTSADAWMAFGSIRLAVTPQWGMEIGLGGAHEDPFFSQRTMSVRIRRSF